MEIFELKHWYRKNSGYIHIYIYLNVIMYHWFSEDIIAMIQKLYLWKTYCDILSDKFSGANVLCVFAKRSHDNLVKF